MITIKKKLYISQQLHREFVTYCSLIDQKVTETAEKAITYYLKEKATPKPIF
jgi:hypothetical protein